ncbi:MAG: FAD-dependent oxidoreductase [Gammaproteobacteria bacterium]|nr:FAD-dependent oxidoreductase [Gammaproteobacteria bacterium]
MADELVLESGASALLHALVVGAFLGRDRMSSVKIETSGGRLEVRANCFVDATGDAVVARHAGAPLKAVQDGEHRMGMSLVFRLRMSMSLASPRSRGRKSVPSLWRPSLPANCSGTSFPFPRSARPTPSA